MINYSLIDRLIISFDHLLQDRKFKATNSPAAGIIDHQEYSEQDYKHSAQLMRINHSGEICAQALYHGQALLSKNANQYNELMQSAQEELVHLSWCQERLNELNNRPSILTPFWFIGSYCLGVIASLFGDHYSNGFIYETEEQVSKHLKEHLTILPQFDQRSRAILQQMLIDEQQHAQKAQLRGSKELPASIKKAMTYTAAIFKRITMFI